MTGDFKFFSSSLLLHCCMCRLLYWSLMRWKQSRQSSKCTPMEVSSGPVRAIASEWGRKGLNRRWWRRYDKSSSATSNIWERCVPLVSSVLYEHSPRLQSVVGSNLTQGSSSSWRKSCPGCSWLVCLALPFYLATKLLRHACLMS